MTCESSAILMVKVEHDHAKIVLRNVPDLRRL